LRAISAVHLEIALRAARNLLLPLWVQVRPALLVRREQPSLRIAQVLPRDTLRGGGSRQREQCDRERNEPICFHRRHLSQSRTLRHPSRAFLRQPRCLSAIPRLRATRRRPRPMRPGIRESRDRASAPGAPARLAARGGARASSSRAAAALAEARASTDAVCIRELGLRLEPAIELDLLVEH